MSKVYNIKAINYDKVDNTKDTLSLGAWVDDYETAYEWAKNWKPSEVETSQGIGKQSFPLAPEEEENE